MKFKELIQKYKEGNLTGEEAKLIEQEIEKYEAIEEYLNDNISLDFSALDEDFIKEGDSKELQQGVSKLLRKVILTSVFSALAILLCVFYVVSPIVDSFYYNPNKSSFGNSTSDLIYDLQVFTELNIPGYGLSFPTHAERLGFGKYNIYFGRSKQFTQVKEIVNMRVERGRLLSNDKSLHPEHFIYFPTYLNPEAFDEQSI